MSKNINHTTKSVGPLTTTRWKQEYPYNYLYPSNYLMGCTGVALAQVLRFMQFPVMGRGTIPAVEGGRPSLDIDGYVYEWENMPDNLSDDQTEENMRATSTFIKHAAYVTGAVPYERGVSGNLGKHLADLKDNLGCDINATVVEPTDATLSYSMAELANILREQLDHNCPVYYEMPLMGHAVVCDGYDEEGKFSFNFGYGEEPVWHRLEDLPGYSIIKIRPELAESLFCSAMSLSATPAHPGDSAEVTLQISNNTTESFSAEMRVVATDLPGVVRNVLSEIVTVGVDADSSVFKTFTITLPADMTFGQRFIQAEYRGTDGFFRPIRDSELNLVREPFVPARQMSECCTLASELEVPAVIAANETLTLSASVNFQGEENTEKFFSVVLMDSFYSTRFVVGTSRVKLTSAEPNNMTILCTFSDVLARTDYMLALVESESPEPVINQASLVGSTRYPCAYPIHVKGDNFEISDEFVLVQHTEIPDPIYDHTPLKIIFDIELIKEIDTRRYFQLHRADVNGDTLDTYPATEISGLSPETKSYPVGLTIELLDVDSVINIFSLIEYRSDGNGGIERRYIPLKDSSTPAEITLMVMHRNLYDFMYLSAPLELSAESVSVSESFTASGAWIFAPENSNFHATGIVLCAMAQDSAGNIREVGRVQEAMQEANRSRDFSINCAFDDTYAKGSYQIFIRAAECNNFDGPERDKMYGLNEDIVIMRDILLK